MWYLIVSVPDRCPLYYFGLCQSNVRLGKANCVFDLSLYDPVNNFSNICLDGSSWVEPDIRELIRQF